MLVRWLTIKLPVSISQLVRVSDLIQIWINKLLHSSIVIWHSCNLHSPSARESISALVKYLAILHSDSYFCRAPKREANYQNRGWIPAYRCNCVWNTRTLTIIVQPQTGSVQCWSQRYSEETIARSQLQTGIQLQQLVILATEPGLCAVSYMIRSRLRAAMTGEHS